MFRRPEGEFKPPVEPKAVPMPQVYKSVKDHSGWLNTAKILPGSLDKEVRRNYEGLKKPVNTQNDIETMLDSSGMHFVLYLILQISGNVVGMECAQKLHANDLPEDCDQVLVELVRLLEWVSALIDENLPDEEDFKASRFGSKKFRVFHEALLRGCREKLQQFLLKCSEWNDENLEGFPMIMSELYSYFVNSFGNSVRIDYGSGHELNFLAFLAGLNRINCVKGTLLNFKYLGTIVFQNYLLVVRNLQRIYRLEPAGSHGVWGLDDFQFISYIIGASQLIGHKLIKPKSIVNKDILEAYSKKYIYLGCISFIYEVKKGPFHEHSPLLFDISGVPHWEKVHTGLLKMFVKEVLEKVPIMQHFEFGLLLPYDRIQ